MPIPINFSTPERITAKKRAYAQILEWIIDGTLLPKEKLNDADLAKALGVSRTPIREALQLLNVQGFVEMFPGVGTQVTTIKEDEIVKILPPLAVLQALGAELTAGNIHPDAIRELRKLNRRFKAAISEREFHAALRWDEQFHRLIIESSQNPYILNTVETFQAHIRRLYFHQSITIQPESADIHEAIIQALETGDKEKAAQLSRSNWLYPLSANQPAQ